MQGIIKTLFTDNNQTVALIPRTTADAVQYDASRSIKTVVQEYDGLMSVKAFWLDYPNWSSTTVTVNGTAYYTYTITDLTIKYPYPTVSIWGTPLPTEAEKEAYMKVEYVTTDMETNTMTLYAKEKPTSAFFILVKGVE